MKLEAVLWTGNNLKEVIEFTGKAPKFNKWFASWEEYEKYVNDHNNIFKLFSPNGLSVEVKPNTWIVKLPNGYNVPVENCWEAKPTEKKNKPSSCDFGYGGRCWDDGNF